MCGCVNKCDLGLGVKDFLWQAKSTHVICFHTSVQWRIAFKYLFRDIESADAEQSKLLNLFRQLNTEYKI